MTCDVDINFLKHHIFSSKRNILKQCSQYERAHVLLKDTFNPVDSKARPNLWFDLKMKCRQARRRVIAVDRNVVFIS